MNFDLKTMSKGRIVLINFAFILWNAFLLGWDIRSDRYAPLTIFQAIVFGFQIAISIESYLSWKHLSQYQRELDRSTADFKRNIEEYMITLGFKKEP